MEPVITAAVTTSGILGGIELLKFVHGKFRKSNGVCPMHPKLMERLAVIEERVSWMKTYHEEAGLEKKLESLIEKVSGH